MKHMESDASFDICAQTGCKKSELRTYKSNNHEQTDFQFLKITDQIWRIYLCGQQIHCY